MTQITFNAYKDRIAKAIDEKLKGSPLKKDEGELSLVNGFFMQPIQNEIAGKLIIGGPTVPTVAVVGAKTGRLYYFPLKVLLPDIEV